MNAVAETEQQPQSESIVRRTSAPTLSELRIEDSEHTVFMSFYTTLHRCRASGQHQEFGRAIANLEDEVRARVLVLMRNRIADPSIAVTEFICRAVPELAEDDRDSMRSALEKLMANDKLFANYHPPQDTKAPRAAAQQALASIDCPTKTAAPEIDTTAVPSAKRKKSGWRLW